MWLVLLGVLGVGGFLLWQKSAHGAAPHPQLPAVFTSLEAGKLYMLNVFTTNPAPPAQPPDLSTSLVTFLASQLPLQGAGKIAQVAQNNVASSALPPDVPRPSPGVTMTQWGVVMLTTAPLQLPRSLAMPSGMVAYVQNAFLVMGTAKPAPTAAVHSASGCG
jgi:hypothetical protein